MRIVDLTEDLAPLYCVCLEDWSQEMAEAGPRKLAWYESMRQRGLRVKLALDDAQTAGGMIQYLPIEESFASGKDLYFILCIWVHGYKTGRGNFRKRGMGKALLAAAEADARDLGAKGMAAWGVALPVWMRASWFRRHGYRVADRDGMRHLLWKPFVADAQPPRWVEPRKAPAPVPGKVSVVSLVNGWCPAQNLACERARRAAAACGEGVEFRESPTRYSLTESPCALGLRPNSKPCAAASQSGRGRCAARESLSPQARRAASPSAVLSPRRAAARPPSSTRSAPR
jgi:GNAT superfamily N-acetyltransferase